MLERECDDRPLPQPGLLKHRPLLHCHLASRRCIHSGPAVVVREIVPHLWLGGAGILIGWFVPFLRGNESVALRHR